MRNWHPFIPDTIREMSEKGVKNVVGMIMAAHQSDASWERYQRDVQEALTELGIEMEFKYSAPLFDHPLFIEDSADRVLDCLNEIPPEEYSQTMILFTAHSIPTPMAEASQYVEQLTTTARLIAEKLDYDNWRLVYQSRSDRPTDPWLEPDVCEVIEEIAKEGVKNVIVQPIGFICDHIEVLFDIGIQAQEVSDKAGINLLRAKTVNDDPKFIEAMADVVKKMVD
jgi:ferrochelatase